jgi:rhodanese-related sulfurtransferase|tara:strand:- start:1550 stop:1975 length:426 start_codon:yes stop_codon:yes gene_type:complete
MGNQSSSVNQLNFEDIQEAIKNKGKYMIINTLSSNNQSCLLPNTIDLREEESIINKLLSNNKEKFIIIYGKNVNDATIYDKYEQLLKLGFLNVYIYPGGMFEWLCLQDIYSSDIFPTTKKELDILKYKPVSKFNTLYLTNE